MYIRVGRGGRIRLAGPLGCLLSAVLFTCVIGLFGGIFALVFSVMRSSDVVQQAVAVAQKDDAAVRALGEPITLGWFLSGSMSTSGSSGKASLTLPVSGPDGKGALYVNAYKDPEGWHFMTLELQVKPDGPLLDLLRE